jgi:hypothetical protein
VDKHLTILHEETERANRVVPRNIITVATPRNILQFPGMDSNTLDGDGFMMLQSEDRTIANKTGEIAWIFAQRTTDLS